MQLPNMCSAIAAALPSLPMIQRALGSSWPRSEQDRHVAPAEHGRMHQHALGVDQSRQRNADAERPGPRRLLAARMRPDAERDRSSRGRRARRQSCGASASSGTPSSPETTKASVVALPPGRRSAGRCPGKSTRPSVGRPGRFSGPSGAPHDQAELVEAVDDRGDGGFVEAGSRDDVALRYPRLEPDPVKNLVGVESGGREMEATAPSDYSHCKTNSRAVSRGGEPRRRRSDP